MVVKLQRSVNRQVGDKTYYKWQVVLPAEVVEELGWKAGDELTAEAVDDELVLRQSEGV